MSCLKCNKIGEDEKVCFSCQKIKKLNEFEITTNPHLLKMKHNKGRCYRCFECVALDDENEKNPGNNE